MKCLVDNQLPAALARYLTSRGVESVHVRDVGLRNSSDREIWYATENDCVLITKDQDFMIIASKSVAGRVVWVRLGNCRTAQLLNSFERFWDQIQASFERSENREHIVELL